jgi:hypothetical protein
MKNRSIAARFTRAQLALKNAKENQEIRSRLAEFGYNDKRLAVGEQLYQKAYELYLQQTREYSDQYQATDAKENQRDQIHKIYMKHITLARLAFQKNSSVAASLDLFSRRKKAFTPWLMQAKLFYANLLQNEEQKTALAEFGVTTEQLEEVQKMLSEIESIHNAQQKEKGEAQEATQERDDAFEKLDEWLSDFFTVARLALQDKSQLLEAFGIVVPSGQYEFISNDE